MLVFRPQFIDYKSSLNCDFLRWKISIQVNLWSHNKVKRLLFWSLKYCSLTLTVPITKLQIKLYLTCMFSEYWRYIINTRVKSRLQKKI